MSLESSIVHRADPELEIGALTEMAAECRGPALLSPKAERKDEIAKRYHARFNLTGSSLLSRRAYINRICDVYSSIETVLVNRPELG